MSIPQYTLYIHFPAHICAVFKLDPKEDGAKLDDPGLDTELVNLVMDKVDQVGKTD